jgi:hypothetical protein
MVRDERLVQKTETARKALCEAYNNQVPGHPQLCTANPVLHLPARPITH